MPFFSFFFRLNQKTLARHRFASFRHQASSAFSTQTSLAVWFSKIRALACA